MFLERNTCCLSFMVTNMITNMFHNHKQNTQSILGICPTRGCTKRAQTNKIKQRWHFLCLHLSAIFGHNVTHVLRQSLTSFSVFKQGTRLSKSSTTSRHAFPTAISHLFSMKISFLMIYNGESAS